VVDERDHRQPAEHDAGSQLPSPRKQAQDPSGMRALVRSRTPVVAGISEHHNCWHVEGIGGRQNPRHECTTDAAALLVGRTPSGPSASKG
jgi:hypothetical protein